MTRTQVAKDLGRQDERADRPYLTFRKVIAVCKAAIPGRLAYREGVDIWSAYCNARKKVYLDDTGRHD